MRVEKRTMNAIDPPLAPPFQSGELAPSPSKGEGWGGGEKRTMNAINPPLAPPFQGGESEMTP